MPARPPVVVEGALAGHHLARLRDVGTSPDGFRRAAHALSTLVLATALAELETRHGTVTTPLAEARTTEPARRVTVVPILRAGLVMLQPALELLPENTRVGFLGMARDERTAQARAYLDSLPSGLEDDEVVMLDVMVATGGSSVAALRSVREAGAKRLHMVGLIAAPEGLAVVAEADPEVPVTVAVIDDHLNDRAFIVPGLGDAGDRLYAEPGGR
ncbi:MAG: uracil phosphoribosyltransferase [Thermoleophilia bacterium]